MCELRILTFSFLCNMFYLPAVFQLLLMTDVTDMQTVPAAPPTPTGASGVMIRNASQQAATAAWSVFAGGRRHRLLSLCTKGVASYMWCSWMILWAASSQIVACRLINYECSGSA